MTAVGEARSGNYPRRVWIEDVELLVSDGATMSGIADRMNVTTKSLYRILYRKGRLDLWRKERIGRPSRLPRYACTVCGVAVDPEYVQRTGKRVHGCCQNGDKEE